MDNASNSIEIAYRVAGSNFKRKVIKGTKTMTAQQKVEQFIEKLEEKHGDCVEVRF